MLIWVVRINYAPGGMSVYGTSAGAGATATPEEEEEVFRKTKRIRKTKAKCVFRN